MSRVERRWSTHRRGQRGATMIELLITVVLGAVVVIPLFGLVNQVLLQRKPVVESAAASKQLSIFRSVLAGDWASADAIIINPTFPESDVYCNGPGYNAGPIRVAMLNSVNKVAQVNGVDVPYTERILYQERVNGDGTISIYRLVCRHKEFQADGTWIWETGQRSDEVQTIAPGVPSQTPPIPIGQEWKLLDRVRAIVVPPTHTCKTTTKAPYPVCDMNLTLVGVDDDDPNRTYSASSPYAASSQRSTLRLHQQVGGPPS